jgi:Domain of unknown function (DUF309)
VVLPRPLRNRLAELILEALRDGRARDLLRSVVSMCDDARVVAGSDRSIERPGDLLPGDMAHIGLGDGLGGHAREFCQRARRGWEVVRARPLHPRTAPLEVVLDEAADLFDGRLYFEVHEHLEPYWFRASGSEREALQGLIQVAVGLHHLSNGNLPGARQLLAEGAAKLRENRLAGIELDGFACAIEECHLSVVALGESVPAAFGWDSVPPFPRWR